MQFRFLSSHRTVGDRLAVLFNPPQTTASKMLIKLHKKNKKKKRKEYNLHKGLWYCRAVASDCIGFAFVHVISWKANTGSSYSEIHKTITNRFLGLGGGQRRGGDVGSLSQKRLECGRIQVLHRKTSPCCLQGAWKQRNILAERNSFHANMCAMQGRKWGAPGNDGLNNKTEAFRQFSPPAVLFCRFSSCWSNIKYLNETGSCGDLSIEVLLSLLLLHLQGKAWA